MQGRAVHHQILARLKRELEELSGDLEARECRLRALGPDRRGREAGAGKDTLHRLAEKVSIGLSKLRS